MSIAVGVVVGLFVGVVVGALGAGGGILTMPILVYVLDFAPHSAAMASLIIVGATSLVSLIPHARRGNVQFAQGVAFGTLGAAGAVAGARLAALVDAALLMVFFAGLLLFVAALMLRRTAASRKQGAGNVSDTASRPPTTRWGWPIVNRSHRWRRGLLTVVLASFIGLLTGFFGVGGGFAVVPALLLVVHVPVRLAVGTSLLVVVVNTLTGLLGRIGESFTIDWGVVVTFAVASMLSGLLGARLSGRARPTTLSLLFAILLTVVALATGIKSVPETVLW